MRWSATASSHVLFMQACDISLLAVQAGRAEEVCNSSEVTAA